MAILHVNFFSEVLAHNTAFNVVLPQSCPAEDIPTVYLLHGMTGNHADWCSRTRIVEYAEQRQIAVVMPDGENGFYTDMKYGKRHFTYVSEELVAYTRRIFRLSTKREKTFTCGMSMGGYGAFLLALRKPEQYAACASLSGCVDIVRRLGQRDFGGEAVKIWGEDYMTGVQNARGDLMQLIRDFPADKPKPRMFAVCGREDFLYGNNLGFRDFMADKAFDFTYREGAGEHTWQFGDMWVGPALDFLLEK